MRCRYEGRSGSKTLLTTPRCWEEMPPDTRTTQEVGPLLRTHAILYGRLVASFSTLGSWSSNLTPGLKPVPCKLQPQKHQLCPLGCRVGELGGISEDPSGGALTTPGHSGHAQPTMMDPRALCTLASVWTPLKSQAFSISKLLHL